MVEYKFIFNLQPPTASVGIDKPAGAAILASFPTPKDTSMTSTNFAFPSNEIRHAMIATGSLAGAIKKMFYDEAMVDIPDEMLRSIHAQIATGLMYVYIEGRYLINPFSFEMEKIDELISDMNYPFSITAAVSGVPMNFPKTKFNSSTQLIHVKQKVLVSDVLEMMSDVYATKYVCHTVCNLINSAVPKVHKNMVDHNRMHFASAYQRIYAESTTTAKYISYQVMGQLMGSVEAIGQTPSVNGSGFVSSVSRKDAIVHMLEKDPTAVFELDIAVSADMIEHVI